MSDFPSDDAAVRVEILRALVARFGSVTPIPAADAFEVARGHRIGAAAMTHRRQRDALPWPAADEVRDGARYLVPLPKLAAALAGGERRRPRRGPGRPPKIHAAGVEVGAA
ncbi:MAG: hypothetical protein J0H27_14230 [Xanthomonadales bacterium]|nr:hypothetical protein [Xanthomonadales bacterium]ODU93081.1 MAG: hypothetical protein ABT18_09970 [Rhodanobacter sp. SCN 66-43]OJY83750.1 MAG: hypothetical protein BGP23_14040 [Xanthomonadales bacterium 66-474]